MFWCCFFRIYGYGEIDLFFVSEDLGWLGLGLGILGYVEFSLRV